MIAETLARTIKISGVSAQEASATMMQFSQAMASGRLSGDEFRSLAESAPYFMKKLADALGVTTGELKKLGSEGELTSQKLATAIQIMQADVARDVARIPQTFSDAMTQLDNSATKMFGSLDQSISVTGNLNAAVSTLSESMSIAADAIVSMDRNATSAGENTALKEWAETSAVGIAHLIDAARLAGMIIGQLLDTQNAVLEDLKLAAFTTKSAVTFDFSGFEKAINERNQKIAEINKRSADRILGKVQLVTDAVNTNITARNAFNGDGEAQRMLGSSAPRLTDFTKSQNKSAQSSYMDDMSNAGNATKRKKALEDEDKAFKTAIQGLDKNSRKYIELLDRHNERVSIINEKHSDKSSKSGENNVKKQAERFGNEIANIEARIKAEQQLYKALTSSGVDYRKLNEGEKQAIKYREEAAATTDKAKKAHLEYLAVKADELGLQIEANSVAERQREIDNDIQGAFQDRIASLGQELTKLKEQNATYGLTSTAIADINLARAEEALALARLDPAAQKNIGWLEAEVALRKKLREESARNEFLEASASAAKQAEEDWKRTSQQIESALTDALMKGFESGKSFVKSLRDSIVNTFKTLVVRIAMQPVMGAVNGFGMGMYGSGGMGDPVGGAYNLWSMLSSGYDMFQGGMGGLQIGNMTSGLAQSFGESGIGGWLGWSDGGHLTQLGADNVVSIGNYAQTIGNVMSWATVGYDVFGALKTGKGWGKAAGGALGTAFLPGIGTAVGSVVGGLLDSVFGGGGGPKSGGEYYGEYTSKGALIQGNHDWKWFDEKTNLDGMKALADTAAQQYAALAGLLGVDTGNTGFRIGFNADPQGDDEHHVSYAVYKAGKEYGAGGKWIEGGRSQEELEAMLADAQSRMVLEAIKQSEGLDSYIADMLSIDLRDASKSELDGIKLKVEQVAGTLAAFGQFSGLLEHLSSVSTEAKMAISELAGGLDVLGQQLSAYYDGYYSEAEKLDTLSRQVSDALSGVGIAMPKTRGEFRELVESLDLNTEAGRKAYATMMQTAGAFGQVADAAAQAAEASLAAVYAERLAIADEYAGLLDAAVQRVRDAYAREISAKQALHQRLAGYVDSLKRLRDQLKVGDLSTGGPEDRYREAEKLWKDTLAKAQGGDAEAQGALASVAEQFLELSREYNASSAQYASDWQAVYDQLGKQEEAARKQLSHEQRQLGTLQSHLAELVGVNETLLTIAEALAQLAELKANNPMQKPDMPVGPGGNGSIGDYGGYVDPTKLSEKEKAINRLYQELLGRDADVAGLKYWLETGLSLDAIRWNIEQDKKVNGSHRGGLDYVPFDGYVAELHKGERVLTAAETRAMDFSRYGRSDSAPLVAEIRALREEVATLRAERRQADASHQSQRAGLAVQQIEQGRQQTRVLQRLQADSL